MQKILNFKKKLESLSDFIYQNENFLIATHVFPDGDALGSIVALYYLICSLKKNAIMICNSEIPYQYQFLPSIEKINQNYREIYHTDDEYVLICLDSADRNRLKLDFEKLNKKIIKLINIDHHLSNTNYGDINLVIPEKSATAEILYQLVISNFKNYLNYEIALGLYTGILTDTGRFQYSNTTPMVHKIISHLLEYGINPSHVFNHIYENEPHNRFKLLQLVLKRIKVVKTIKFICSYVLQKDFEKLNLPFSSNDGIIELLRSDRNVEVAALFKEVEKDRIKVSLRSSNNNINVSNIAKKFGGGGHLMAAAYASNGKLKEVISDLINALENNNSIKDKMKHGK